MSVTPDFLHGLDELVRTDLQRLRDSYFNWLLVSTGVLILGVLLEGPELFWEVRQIFRNSGPPENDDQLVIPIATEPRTPRWIILLSLAGWLIVCVGVAGEGVFEGFVSTADGLLQTFNDNVLSNASDRASHAEITAKAFEFQIADANKRAAEANQVAEEERLARVRLEKQIQPRTITQSDRERLGKELRKFRSSLAGKKVKMSSQIGDAEGMLFSLEIIDILHRAGIDTEDVGLGRVEGVGAVYMGVNVTGPLNQENFIRSLVSGLSKSTDTNASGEWKSENTDVGIMVGVKPLIGIAPQNPK